MKSNIINKTAKVYDNVSVKNSKIFEKCILYQNSKVTNSTIGHNSIVGDFSRVTSSNLEGYNKILRNAHFANSKMGLCSYIGDNTVVLNSSIGRFCSISWGVSIGGGEHDFSKITTHNFLYDDFCEIRPLKSEPFYDRFKRKLEIGHDVWIGANSIILRGVTIGDGAVVGAGSIVTKDVPPYSIVIGTPAKVIKKRFSDEIISSLKDLKWWDLELETIRNNYKLFNDNDIVSLIKKISKIKKEK